MLFLKQGHYIIHRHTILRMFPLWLIGIIFMNQFQDLKLVKNVVLGFIH